MTTMEAAKLRLLAHRTSLCIAAHACAGKRAASMATTKRSVSPLWYPTATT
jgi:hypothetical protein